MFIFISFVIVCALFLFLIQIGRGTTTSTSASISDEHELPSTLCLVDRLNDDLDKLAQKHPDRFGYADGLLCDPEDEGTFLLDTDDMTIEAMSDFALDEFGVAIWAELKQTAPNIYAARWGMYTGDEYLDLFDAFVGALCCVAENELQ